MNEEKNYYFHRAGNHIGKIKTHLAGGRIHATARIRNMLHKGPPDFIVCPSRVVKKLRRGSGKIHQRPAAPARRSLSKKAQRWANYLALRIAQKKENKRRI